MRTPRAFVALLLLGSAAAHGAPLEIDVRSELSPARPLKPGEFSWAPEISPSGKVVVVVDLEDQLVHVYRGGHEIGRATVSTGKAGYRTPTGPFRILEKKVLHHSTSYELAPMPFMQRLTWDGVALHGGINPGAPVSHGCVRLPQPFAQALFWATSVGDPVVVATRWDSRAPAAEPEELSPAAVRLRNAGT